MGTKYNKNTSIRLDPEIKGWLYTRRNNENRSLGNLINTILKQEKERDEQPIDIEKSNQVAEYWNSLNPEFKAKLI